MEKCFRTINLAVLLIFFLSQIGFTNEIPDVFICQSYGPGDKSGGLVIEPGTIEKLKSLGWEDGKTMNLHYFYMDTLANYKSPEYIKMRSRLALEEIDKADKEVGIDLLIIFDDNAFEYVALPLAKTKYKILFNGINVDPEYYDKDVDFMQTREHPGYNISGVKEQSVSRVGAKLVKMLIPDATKMVILASATYPYLAQMANELEQDIIENPESYPLELEGMYRASSWEDYQRLTLEMDQRDDVDVIFHYSPHGQYDKSG
ncbi:MAG: hypothetical protein ABIC18_01530, partial [Candidatus Omnitrophota bacterium]